MIAWTLLLTVLAAAMGVTVALFIANAPRRATRESPRYLLAILFPVFLGIVMAVSAHFYAFFIGGLVGTFIMWMDLSKEAKPE